MAHRAYGGSDVFGVVRPDRKDDSPILYEQRQSGLGEHGTYKRTLRGGDRIGRPDRERRRKRDRFLAGGDNAEPSGRRSDGRAYACRDGRTLVVYYSATGNTEEAANYIAAAANADIFELTPVEPYTSDDLNWTDENSRVVYEHDNPDARDVELVSTTVPNWDSYDTVFIGYPIWWGIAAWPVTASSRPTTSPVRR